MTKRRENLDEMWLSSKKMNMNVETLYLFSESLQMKKENGRLMWRRKAKAEWADVTYRHQAWDGVMAYQ